MKKAANFLRLIDEDGNLSLTNLAVLIVLVKIAMATEVSLVDAGTMLVALMSYQGKKVINRGARRDGERIAAIEKTAQDALTMTGELIKRVDELGAKVNAAQMKLGIKELR